VSDVNVIGSDDGGDVPVSQEPSSVIEAVSRHMRQFFEGHRITREFWPTGPIVDAIAEFHILCIEPGPRTGSWCYASVGVATINHVGGVPLEFFILSPWEDTRRQVEQVTMVAWYHQTDKLGLGHTLSIGQGWMPNSACDHFLISRPYPFGPKLEICKLPNGQANILWALPITKAERDFKAKNGVEKLEQLFDDVALEFSKPDRQSVV
jgi:hypothetical protein